MLQITLTETLHFYHAGAMENWSENCIWNRGSE